MATQKVPLITPEEYLARERASDVRHEYVGGQVFAMAGASTAHTLIAANLLVAFRSQIAGLDCDVAMSDHRMYVERTRMYTYPDLILYCGGPHYLDGVFDTLLNPRVLVEILSESTEAYDRGEKFAHYRTLPTLQDYLLVSQQRQRMEHFARQHDDSWKLSVAEKPDDMIHLSSAPVRLDLETVYFRVNVPLFQVTEAVRKPSDPPA